jgi:hypothetical protein
LTSVVAILVGLERVFHLDQMQDLGFALLTGDARRCPSRHDVGAWRRHVLWNEVDRFCHRTSPWDLLHQRDLVMSFDEHGIPRWTKKFVIPKGYLTTRNKFMRCEKLYMGYEVNLRRFATIKATPGKVELRDVASLLTRRVLRYGQPSQFDEAPELLGQATVKLRGIHGDTSCGHSRATCFRAWTSTLVYRNVVLRRR